jgi:hypothetical protein
MALIVLGFVGLSIGILHLTLTDRLFAFYSRTNDRYGIHLLPGLDRRFTRMAGWGLSAVSGALIIGELVRLAG